jgi:hypothetical protein
LVRCCEGGSAGGADSGAHELLNASAVSSSSIELIATGATTKPKPSACTAGPPNTAVIATAPLAGARSEAGTSAR